MSAAEDASKIEASFSSDSFHRTEFRGETTLTFDASRIRDICFYSRDQLGYDMLLDLSAVDNFGTDPRFEVVYELYSIDRKRISASRSPLPRMWPKSIPSAISGQPPTGMSARSGISWGFGSKIIPISGVS